MIIAMLNENGILDLSTITAKNVLSAQYSEETAQIFSEKIPFLFNKNGNLNLDSQQLPTRLTFIGHSDISIYGKYNATEFANRLIAEINKASKIDPRMRTAIKVIDLLGCETGLVNAQGNSFAQIVSNRLHSAGFSIRVNALSNLTYKDHDPVEATILFNPDKFFFDDAHDTSIFVYGLLKSKSDRKQYYDLFAAKNSLYFQYEFKPVKRFFNLLNQLKLKYDKGEFNTSQYEQEILLLGETTVKGTPFESTFKLASNFNAKMIAILYNLNLNETISILSTSTLNSTAEYIEVILEQLKLHYQKIEINIKEISKMQNKIISAVTIIKNPREYLDTTPSCTFVPAKIKENSRAPSTQQAHSLAGNSSLFYNRHKEDRSRRQPANDESDLTDGINVGYFEEKANRNNKKKFD